MQAPAPQSLTTTQPPTTQPPLLQLSIQQLDYLVAVVEAPTWAVAASKLQVSASALSQGIAELERRLGLQLFERVGRRRVLDPAAEPVLRYARAVLAQTHDIGRWIAEQSAGDSGLLRIGMIDAAALHYFSDALRVFRSRYPKVDLRLTVAPSGQLLDAVQRNDLDLAVVVRPGELPPDLDHRELVEDPMGVYAPAGPKANPNSWGPWVAFPATSHTREQIVKELASRGASYDVVAESNQPEVLCEMVRLGLGWTVLPVIQAEAAPLPLQAVLDEPLFHRPLIAIRRRAALPHPAAGTLLAALQNSSSPGPATPHPTDGRG